MSKKGKKSVRVSMTLPGSLLDSFDETLRAIGYKKRSKAFRDALSRFITEYRDMVKKVGTCSGTITFIYDHQVPKLTDLLVNMQHDYSQIIGAGLHIHLDEKHCLEVLTVRGDMNRVRELAKLLMSTRGVLNLKLTLV